MKRTKLSGGRGPGGVAVLAGALLTAASAFAVDVRGSVRSSEEPKAKAIEAVRQPYFQEWNGFIEPKKPSIDWAREVAVVLVGAHGTKDAATALLKDGTLTPSTLVMQVSTALRVRNEDDFAHQLHAEGLKSFDAIETAAGQGRQIQIDQTGSFVLRDKLAPHVRGHLHVLAKITAVAHPQADGTFAFEDVAPGSYTVKVFRGPREVSSKSLEVEDKREIVIDPVTVDVKPTK